MSEKTSLAAELEKARIKRQQLLERRQKIQVDFLTHERAAKEAEQAAKEEFGVSTLAELRQESARRLEENKKSTADYLEALQKDEEIVARIEQELFQLTGSQGA